MQLQEIQLQEIQLQEIQLQEIQLQKTRQNRKGKNTSEYNVVKVLMKHNQTGEPQFNPFSLFSRVLSAASLRFSIISSRACN